MTTQKLSMSLADTYNRTLNNFSKISEPIQGDDPEEVICNAITQIDDIIDNDHDGVFSDLNPYRGELGESLYELTEKGEELRNLQLSLQKLLKNL